jgi:hypothetical protein
MTRVIDIASRGLTALARRYVRTRHRLRRRFARAIVPADPPADTSMTAPRVEVFIASLDTCAATELTIRSLRSCDQSSYEIVVGDGGSTDGSVEMLKALEGYGWLRLELRADRWRHHEWIEHRIASTEAGYLVFCDSDMEFRGARPVRDLVAMAQRTGAALVAAELCPSGPGVEPFSGSPIVMAARPSAWLFLVAPARVRDLRQSFAFAFSPNGAAVAGGLGYDTGAAWFAELCDRQIPWAVMPGSFTRRFRHHAGLSWRPLLGAQDDRRTKRIRSHIDRRLRAFRDHE